MVSDEKLIKQGIKYTDALFAELEKRIRQGLIKTDTLESFLEKTKQYTTANPLVSTGYQDTLIKLILAEANNHKFSRPAQKELVRVTIEQYIADLIRNVGEDIKQDVRDIVREGYNKGLSQYEIADIISERISVIKNTRANAIARTEIARAATVSDYIINKERGATHFTVDCRNTACDICKKEYLKNPDREATGRGMTGDKVYPIDQVEHLPPLHPRCRCNARYTRQGKSTEELRSHIHIL